MGILKDLDKLVEKEIDDEEDIEPTEDSSDESPSVKDIAADSIEDEEEEQKISGGKVGDLLKHIDAIKAAIKFVDTLTGDGGETPAFEAEISLRKAVEKMQALSDDMYDGQKE